MQDWVILVVALVCIILLASLITLCLHRGLRKTEELHRFGSITKSRRSYPVAAVIPIKVQPGDSNTDKAEILNEPLAPTEQSLGLSRNFSLRSNAGRVIEMEDGRRTPIHWRVWFKLFYEPATDELNVTLFRMTMEPVVRRMLDSHLTGIFAQIALLPDENQQFQSAVYANTGSPSFDETFSFKVDPAVLNTQQLRISVYEQDKDQIRVCLGHTVQDLAEVADNIEGVHYLHKELKPYSESIFPSNNICEALVSLCFSHENQRLTIQFLSCRKVEGLTESGNFALRVDVIIGRQSVKTKLGEAKSCLQSVLNCTYNFTVPQKHIETCCLKFTLLHVVPPNKDVESGTQTPPIPLGYLILGPCMYAHGTGLDHWKKMLSNMRRPIQMWHVISRTKPKVL